MTPAQRSTRARAAAHARWANTSDTVAATKPARDAYLAQFETQVDPDGALAPEERRRRALSARRAHMTGLALKSSQARSRVAGR